MFGSYQKFFGNSGNMHTKTHAFDKGKSWQVYGFAYLSSFPDSTKYVFRKVTKLYLILFRCIPAINEQMFDLGCLAPAVSNNQYNQE